ncbi:hypothetical protein [Legionella jamestowniensis]|uniref:Uncharacterized protein n=1 Tax=Legionella jamestowniensis TaxID=455 RepID=A0A0W0UW89_9GAMM|nr:hypothetical protein [Legionella jamestowniensis]KTD12133.1 hypothetical protein Ljam_0349 [Legionella jamestowniensis]SFM04630.1 hypothetical protein SAMN02746073_0140 [Legionella jamestowniensis DSM 19215]
MKKSSSGSSKKQTKPKIKKDDLKNISGGNRRTIELSEREKDELRENFKNAIKLINGE